MENPNFPGVKWEKEFSTPTKESRLKENKDLIFRQLRQLASGKDLRLHLLELIRLWRERRRLKNDPSAREVVMALRKWKKKENKRREKWLKGVRLEA